MKTYTILKYMHFSNFIPCIKYLGSSYYFYMPKNIALDYSCKYSIDEKSCVNKLFGWCHGLFGVHKNSVRFGWTYNNATNMIDIWSYIYDNKILHKTKIESVELGREYNFMIAYKYNKTMKNTTVELSINGATLYCYTFNKKLSQFIYTLGFYFGGNTRAPHTMKIFKF